MSLINYSLEDRFVAASGDVALSGVQALYRTLLDQLRADTAVGLNPAALVSGYRGSPLGGVDAIFAANPDELAAHNITFLPAINEDLGATAVWGSQMANRNFDGRYSGVLGMWYGKAPGLERSGDAIRHANIAGVDPQGGVLMVVGDDPASKSSTLTSGSEFTFVQNATPVLYPGNVQEVADFGRWGYALSRYSGLWAGMKVVTNVADGYATLSVGPERVQPEKPEEWMWQGKPWAHSQEDDLFGANAVRMEHEMADGRLRAAERFIAHNRLNRATVNPPQATLGFVAAGKTYYDLTAALERLGFDEATLVQRGVRLFKPAVIWPLEQQSLRAFAQGIDTVVVVEEKRSFIETLAREALYGMGSAPRIMGKERADGSRWFPAHGEMDVDLIAGLLEPFLVERFGRDSVASAQKATARKLIPLAAEGSDATRTAGFCSGCPHNTSTVLPEGSEAGGGIGCHSMVAIRGDRETYGLTHMGGEGAQWVGAAPFVTMPHRFQNIGDGTFHHSGSLALRQAVAAGTNITYKILYNDAVAMTGGQAVDGQLSVPALTRSVEAEGVARTIVVTDDTSKYHADDRFATGTEVWHRSRLDEAQRVLRDIPGTTVLIYDQACAAELRRDRKRGRLPTPKTRIFINEAVCEGCGDCGVKSSCLSVQPVETEFGRKTRIHQPSCNFDYSCVDGDCPAFVEVVVDESAGPRQPSGKAGGSNASDKAAVAISLEELVEPERLDEGDILMMGIGGTGVVTVNQVLSTAVLLDGKQATGLDQTGLSQKGGSVVSNLKVRRMADVAQRTSGKVSAAGADAYLVFDVLTGVNPVNLEKADPERTVAVVSSAKVPTGLMVRDTAAAFPEWDAIRTTLESATVADRNVYLDAAMLAQNLFGTDLQSNLILVGAAYQRGVIPIAASAIEAAIGLNGVAVEANVAAFRAGRKAVQDPAWLGTVGSAIQERNQTGEEGDGPKRPGRAVRSIVDLVPEPSPELRRILEIRVPDLIDYQDKAYARRYVDLVAEVRTAELALGPNSDLSEAVARYYYKLLAYKDEYEVARLYRSEAFTTALEREFGPQAKVTYKLHPPLLRRLGREDKIGFGRSGDVAFAALARMKRLRGTGLDLFGRTAHRRLERDLIDEYRDTIGGLLRQLTAANVDGIVAIAKLPDMVRGYEEVKEANVAEYRNRLRELVSEL